MLLAILSLSTSSVAADVVYDRYGGWLGAFPPELGGRGGRSNATGFFRTEQIQGSWWFITPEGNAFLSKGVNHISFEADHSPALGYAPYGRATRAKYGDSLTWAQTAIRRLRKWNFNTVGAWSNAVTFDRGMPYTSILDIAGSMADWRSGQFPDVFSEQFSKAAEEKAAALCAPASQDSMLIGYFLDNELRWAPDWRSSNTLFDDFLTLPADAPGKRALVESLRLLYGDIDALNEAWHTHLSSFDDLLSVTQLSQLEEVAKTQPPKGEAVAYEELHAKKELQVSIPKEMAQMYLNFTYGNIDEVNAALGTRAASFDELLTAEFLQQLTEKLSQQHLPQTMVKSGIQMFYGSIEEANRAFGTQADSFDELVAQLYASSEPSPVVQEIQKARSHFLKAIAGRYFRVCHDAIRKYDPNHLILGCRFAGYAPTEVVEAMAPYVDVISYNHYGPLPPKEELQRIYAIARKPILITEFSFKAMDSGLPNTRGAGAPVQTQQERAEGFAEYVRALMQLPFAVGYHWFEHADEPAEGRFDGENSNYGLVNIKDEPWEALVKRMTEVNASVESWHAQSGLRIPTVPSGHPRVYVRPDDLPTIRAKTEHPQFQKAWKLVRESDSTVCRAFMYLLTGDEEAGRKAIRQWQRDVKRYQGDMDRMGRVFGNLMHQGALVYDWCYNLLNEEEKATFIDELQRIASSHGPGYPADPDGHAVVGHNTEGWLLTGQLPAGVAIYDENQTMYDAAAQLFFRHFVPVRNFVYQAYMHHQGDSYITTRFQHDQAAAWLFRRMGAGDVFSRTQRFVPYQYLYNLRPDGQQMRSGDTFDQTGRDSRKRFIAMMTGAYYGDAILLGVADSDLFHHYGPEGSVFELLFREPEAPTQPLQSLPLTKYFPSPMGEMVARTGWNLGVESRDAVVQMRIGETFFGNHQCKDFGTFQVYYRGPLAISTGLYDEYGNAHWKNYYHQTISKNGLLIFNPSETPKGNTANDGGQRWPRGSDHPRHLDTLLSEDYQMGRVTAHAFGPDPMQPEYSYIAGDITNAYTPQKVERVTRSMVALNTGDSTYPCALVVFDRVVSTNPDFKKTWLLHSIQEPQIVGHTVNIVRNGKAYNGGEYGGKLVVESLLPERAVITKVGGPDREFWIESTHTNYTARLDRAAAEPGAWRVEISPDSPRKSDRFLHVLSVMDVDTTTNPRVDLIDAGEFVGAQMLDFAVLFSTDAQEHNAISFSLNAEKAYRILVCDVQPGRWSVLREGQLVSELQATAEGKCLFFRGEPGRYLLERQ